MKEKVCVVIVTYNRRKYLLTLLNSLLKQTVKPKSIIIVNNNSKDDTEEYLMELDIIKKSEVNVITRNIWNELEIIYYKNPENLGGAGGFKTGFKLVLNEECDYIWVMDDDVEPVENCLENMLRNMNREIKVCVPNRNSSDFSDPAILSFNWNNIFMPVIHKKVIKIKDNSTNYFIKDFPFEGPLFKKEIVEKVGLPNSDYFIFFDDSDYAIRCCKYSKILYVTNAKLKKQIILPKIKNKKFSWRSYYLVRNQIIFDRKNNNSKIVSFFRPYIICLEMAIKYILLGRYSDIPKLIRAFKDGINNRIGKTVEPNEF